MGAAALFLGRFCFEIWRWTLGACVRMESDIEIMEMLLVRCLLDA